VWNGQPGARRWRQVWSDHRLKSLPAREVARLAHAARQSAADARSDAPAPTIEALT
jgi:tRNA-dihydrouridine synthase A